MIVQVCVGSSCHMKGSEEIVELMKQALKERRLEDEVTLAGNFCIGRCSRVGVTVQVDDDVFTGITRESFGSFFEESILARLNAER